jgi:hypothetical protein
MPVHLLEKSLDRSFGGSFSELILYLGNGQIVNFLRTGRVLEVRMVKVIRLYSRVVQAFATHTFGTQMFA